ncbi:MAG TPA: hypothetical protein VL096_08470, partial [Pirellulaceae bacterium]|nr:hypothetical protein [Pirellulaceae bacterium]
ATRRESKMAKLDKASLIATGGKIRKIGAKIRKKLQLASVYVDYRKATKWGDLGRRRALACVALLDNALGSHTREVSAGDFQPARVAPTRDSFRFLEATVNY